MDIGTKLHEVVQATNVAKRYAPEARMVLPQRERAAWCTGATDARAAATMNTGAKLHQVAQATNVAKRYAVGAGMVSPQRERVAQCMGATCARVAIMGRPIVGGNVHCRCSRYYCVAVFLEVVQFGLGGER